jgi:hypothetical protein
MIKVGQNFKIFVKFTLEKLIDPPPLKKNPNFSNKKWENFVPKNTN